MDAEAVNLGCGTSKLAHEPARWDLQRAELHILDQIGYAGFIRRRASAGGAEE